MTERERSVAVTGRRVGIELLALLALAGLLVPVQFATMVLFDATGLDRALPSAAFIIVLPAAVVAAGAAAIALRVHGRRRALVIVAGSIVAYAGIAAYLTRLYRLCAGGAGC